MNPKMSAAMRRMKKRAKSAYSEMAKRSPLGESSKPPEPRPRIVYNSENPKPRPR